MSDRPILVTGAGGFVCSALVLALRHGGHDVVATDQRFDASTAARLKGLRCIEGDLLEVLLGSKLGTPRAIIHGAAITASPEQLGITNATHIHRNTETLTTTLEFARRVGADRFVFLSSMGVFDPDDGPAPHGKFTEATEPTATCPYCAAKRAGELLTTAAADDNLATFSVRLGNIFGPHEAIRETRQHLCLVSRMLAEARDSSLITVLTPEAQREWAWLPDLANAVAKAIDQFPTDGPRVVHAGTPPVVDDLSLARAVAGQLPGTTIRVGSPPYESVRPPMGSIVPGVFDLVRWTALEPALGELVQTKGAQ